MIKNKFNINYNLLIIFIIFIIIYIFNSYLIYNQNKYNLTRNLNLLKKYNQRSNSLTKFAENYQNLETNDDDIETNIDPNNDFLKTKKTNVRDYSVSYITNPSNEDMNKDISIKSKKNQKKQELTKNANSQYAKNSFCQLDNSKTKCVCKFQKDDIKAAFNSPQINCDKICASIEAKDCLENNEFTEIPYYCNIAGKCIKYKGTVVSSHISANNCGTEQLTNQLLLPFSSLEECKKSLDPCNKYNDPKKSVHLNRTECLGNPSCGFCTNSNGEGKCISGNATGPSDLNKYYYCNPYNGNKNNTYEYGNRAEYILENYK